MDQVVLTHSQTEYTDLIIKQVLDGTLNVNQAILKIRNGDLSDVAKKAVEHILTYIILTGLSKTPQAQKMAKTLEEFFWN